MTFQSESEENKILELIVAASEEFLQSDGNKLNYQKITDTVVGISGAKYAVFNLYDEGGNKFITTAISAPDGIIKKVSSLLGFKLPGKKWDYDQVRAWKTKSSTITHFPSLLELTGDAIPKPDIYLLEKTFNTGEVVFVKILKENKIIGDITLIMPKNATSKNDNYIELYSRLLGLLITRKRAEEALRESEEKFRDLAQMLPETVFEINMQGTLTFVNQRTLEVFGYTRQDLDHGIKALDMLIPGDRERGQKEIASSFRGENKGPREYIVQRFDGSTFPILISSSPIIRDGKTVGLRGLIFDITGLKRAEEALQESKKTIERYLNIVAEIIISLDKLGNITMINESGHQLLGYSRDELIGKNWFKTCLPGEMINDVMNVFKKIMNGDIDNVTNNENVVKTKSGEIRTIFWHNTILKDSNGNVTGTISSGEDITERKKAEEEIIYLSFHDHLTGLYNRRFFEEELKRLDTERQLPLSFVMGDLNGLKLINDVFGHAEGDKLLKETAEILRRVCRSDDILTRWGGDEFVLLLPKTSVSDAEEIVERIKKECKKTKRQKISISLSLGTAIKETAAQDIQTVVIDAENNMYKNKLVEKESLTSSIIFALEQALYEKSNETKEHTDRIYDLAIKLGKSIKLSSRQLDELSLLAALHDIGKVAISENILLKKSTLTEKEWKVIKRHPEIGFNIAQSSSQIAHIAKPILYCHENWDGSGYPMGISGESIPVISRIILIADAYDVMTSRRTYKLATSKKDAITELKRCAGSQFDPVLVDKFIEILAN